jgi:hypothetical protein
MKHVLSYSMQAAPVAAACVSWEKREMGARNCSVHSARCSLIQQRCMLITAEHVVTLDSFSIFFYLYWSAMDIFWSGHVTETVISE